MMITKKIGIPVLFLIALTLIFILLSTSENYEAIPSTALDKNYIKNWSKWNDVTINNQIHDGLDELYKQCSARAPNKNGKQFLENKYNLIKKEI